jgi:hypothetical protein
VVAPAIELYSSCRVDKIRDAGRVFLTPVDPMNRKNALQTKAFQTIITHSLIDECTASLERV